MKTFKTRGLILREYEAGESDKRLVILCKGHGRLLVYARGARNPKSKFLASSQLLTYGDFVLADGRQFFSMAQAQAIENFYPIRQDYDLLCHAAYILEICEKAVPERSPCDELLQLALKTLQHISIQDIPAKQAVIVFLFRFILFYGLNPEMDFCSVCSGDLAGSMLFCDEGMICKNCTSKARVMLSDSSYYAIRHILESDLKQSFLFRIEEAVLKELSQTANLCWLGHFQIPLQTDIL